MAKLGVHVNKSFLMLEHKQGINSLWYVTKSVKICWQIRVNLAGFWQLHLLGPFIMIGFLLLWLIQTAAGRVSPHWARPATFIYSQHNHFLRHAVASADLGGWGEYAVLKHRKCIRQNNFWQLFLVCGKNGKMAVAGVFFLLALKAIVAHLWLDLPVWIYFCKKCIWLLLLLVNKHLVLPVLFSFFYPVWPTVSLWSFSQTNNRSEVVNIC